VSVVNIAVSSELNGRTTLTFYDMNGRPVMTDVFTKASRKAVRQVNIARLPKGTYGILIQVDQAEKVVEKLVKY
ncbi:MAG: T9SS type A sorting domain-containing protein, partial [Chitinophagaceae bacterium]|nr:T9SS type A sorting domain-containing protein [Chitinophagaceae bacterium]